MKTNGLARVACRGITVPQRFLSTKPTVFSALARPWEAATGHQSCLLTMQPILLITGMSRAKRIESFRLKEERRDADGDRPWRLQLLLGCEVGKRDTSEQADDTRTKPRAPRTHVGPSGVTGLEGAGKAVYVNDVKWFPFSSLWLNFQNSNAASRYPSNKYVLVRLWKQELFLMVFVGSWRGFSLPSETMWVVAPTP